MIEFVFLALLSQIRKVDLNSAKAQSAMEYLMTYGWAILIIAVVLGALFSTGAFGGSSLLGNACTAVSGYLCQNPVYSHASDVITVQVGQNTGTTWQTANFVFVPQGTPVLNGVPVLVGTTGTQMFTNTLIEDTLASPMTSGQTQMITLPVNSPLATSLYFGGTANAGNTINVGTTATGAIWAYYTTAGITGSTTQYAKLAAINIKAT